MTFNIEYKTIMKETNAVKNAITQEEGRHTIEEGRENFAPTNKSNNIQNDIITTGFNPSKITTDVSQDTTDAEKGRYTTEEGRENLAPTKNKSNDVQNDVITRGFNPLQDTTDDSQDTTADSQHTIDDSEKENIKNSYISKLKQEIENKKYYPKQARRLKYEGVTEVSFVILKNGKITNIKIVNTSNYEIIDEAALDIIKKVNKFEPLPDIFKVEALPVKIPIKYELL